jgi:hypothetical protein
VLGVGDGKRAQQQSVDEVESDVQAPMARSGENTVAVVAILFFWSWRKPKMELARRESSQGRRRISRAGRKTFEMRERSDMSDGPQHAIDGGGDGFPAELFGAG